jgi:hypothetical protein
LLVEAVVIGALPLVDQVASPIIEAVATGARGEEHVGAIIDAMLHHGRLAIHDVSTGTERRPRAHWPSRSLCVQTKATRARSTPRRSPP